MRAAVVWMVRVAVAAVVLLAAGCGGGGDAPTDEPEKTIGPPDCNAHPELCT